ncbi:MAG TPA: hypothetical protein VFS12_00075 [Terriglobia bacterium]|nr:hypothetical protein [Terriglobia bacterium]
MHISLMDMGTLSGMAGMATVGWALAEIDKETETGYERTSTYQGYKSHEEYNRSSKDGEVTVLVADRFVVEVCGNNLPMEATLNRPQFPSPQRGRGARGEGASTLLIGTAAQLEAISSTFCPLPGWSASRQTS